MLRKKHYTHIMVVVHGYSELRLAEYIRSALRIPMVIRSNKNGKLTYQITDLRKLFSNSCDFNNGFIKKYKEDIEFKGSKPINLKVFTIMDKDDTPYQAYQMYKSGSLLKNSNPYFGNLIVPIFNESNLEDVLKDIKWQYAKDSRDKSKVYFNTFPTVVDCDQTKKERIELLEERLRKCSKTNMEDFLEACLKDSR